MKRNIVSTIIFAIFLLLVFILNICMPKQDYSINERRFFANLPKWIENGKLNEDFMSDFELYSADHFPLRESFRSIKGLFSKYVFNKLDNNGLFVVEGHISKIDTPVNEKMIKYSSDLFLKIYEKYLKDSGSNVYLSVIPDKNYFLADKNGYPSMDYDSFIHKVKEQNQYMEYIDVIELLSVCTDNNAVLLIVEIFPCKSLNLVVVVLALIGVIVIDLCHIIIGVVGNVFSETILNRFGRNSS